MEKVTQKAKSNLFLFLMFTILVSLLQLALVPARAQAASYSAVDAALSIDTSSLPSGEVGVFYTYTLTASGGGGTYSWSMSSGLLPPGLSLSPGGVISGTPTADGAYSFTVTVNSLEGEATKGLSITVNPTTVQPPATTTLTITTQLPQTTITITHTQSVVQQTSPTWIYAVIVVDAVLIIAVIVLIIRIEKSGIRSTVARRVESLDGGENRVSVNQTQ